MIETALAQAAVGFLVSKATESAAQAIGTDAYKTAIEKLKGFFSYKFAGKEELTQVENNPQSLTSLVTKEASKDASFRNELAQLVKSLQELSSCSEKTSISYNNVGSVADIAGNSVTNGNVSGRDVIAENQISGNQNYVGGDQRGSTFR
jgi:hypothetical protein